MTEYRSGHQVLSAPLISNTVKMERGELERLCNEQNLPLFHLKVEETVMMGIAQSCTPHMKFFTFYEGFMITATESIKDENITIHEVKS